MIYLCLGGTWVPTVTEKDLFRLAEDRQKLV